MAIFDDMDAAVMDAFGGETATIEPRVREQYAEGAADGGRASASVRGVFNAAPASQGVQGASSEPRAGATGFSQEQAEFWIAAAFLPDLATPIRAGDILRLVERAGQPAYTVAHVQRTDTGDANLILTRNR